MKTFIALYDIQSFIQEKAEKVVSITKGARLSEIYSDISQSLSEDVDKDLKILFNVSSVEASIENIIGTSKGERVMLPTFASNLEYYLFEPVADVTEFSIRNDIISSILEWDPRVIVKSLKVTGDTDNNTYIITLMYEIAGLGLVSELSRTLSLE